MLRKSYNKIFLFLIIILLSIPFVYSLLYAPIYCDSSYYLSVVNRVSEGFTLYDEVSFGYTPFYIYFLVYVKKILNIGIDYEFFLSINFLFIFLIVFIVFKIVKLISNDNKYAIISSILTYLAIFRSDGDAVLLEMPSVFFGLLACYLILVKKTNWIWYLLSGFIASLSFLTKQYGFGFFLLCVLLLFFYNSHVKKKFNLFVCFFTGYILPLVISYLFNPEYIRFIFNGYGVDSASYNVYDGVGFLRNIPWAAKYFVIKMFPLLLFLLYIPFYKNTSLEEKGLIIFIIFGLLGFIFQFYFNKASHYFIYMIPFTSIYIGFFYSKLKNYNINIGLIFNITVVLSFLLLSNSVYRNILYKKYFKSGIKNSEYELAEIIKQNVGTNKTLYIENVSLFKYYYLANIIPPQYNNKIDYSFGPLLLNDERIKSLTKNADFILMQEPPPKWEKRVFEIINDNTKEREKHKIYSLEKYDIVLYE